MKTFCNWITLFVLSTMVFGCGGSSGSGTPTTADPSTPAYEFESAYLQYRQFEDSFNNRCYSWLAITKDDEPIPIGDLDGLTILDSGGGAVNPSSFRPNTLNYMFYSCSVSPCAPAEQKTQSGYFIAYDSLTADTYSIAVDIADGETVTTDIQFPGELDVPLVTSDTMLAQWVNGDLVLGWTNPSSHPDWTDIDQLRIVLFDGDGAPVLFVRLLPTDETVTVPESLVNQAAALGDGTLNRWTVQTRDYDANGMNFARGHSRSLTLP